MNQPFKRNYLLHALAVSQWMAAHGAEGGIDPFTHAMDIRFAGKTVRFFPQFVIDGAEGELHFTPQLRAGVSGFVGWLPYFNKIWPIAQDKLAFKDHAVREGIRTPKWTAEPAQVRGAFIVKGRRSTFGRGLRGPFETATGVKLMDGEYYEQFIVGQLLKAWFWNDELAVVEVVDMPTVVGDGLRTFRQLISSKLAPTDRWPSDLEPLAAIQGLSLDGVVPASRAALADYRYMSVLNPASKVDHNVRNKLKGSQVEAQLLDAGARCWAAVPAQVRQGTAFSLDGVVDRQGKVWFLEANCNPQLHPSFYGAMLNETLLKSTRQHEGTMP